MIEIRQLSKHFQDKIAVADLNLEVGPGEIFAFLGPNGAGKTTTIKMLVGLLRPTTGEIRICGHDMVREHRVAKSLIAYVPDEPYLYNKLTGYEFLDFVGRMYELEKRVFDQRLAALSATFNLESYLHELTESYSHGMKQRVVFAAALLHQPRVMIIDEPMVGLDPKSARIVKDILKQQATQGVTIFMSTHTLQVAEETATDIGIISHGQLVARGSLEQLRAQSGMRTRLEDIFLEITAEDSPL